MRNFLISFFVLIASVAFGWPVATNVFDVDRETQKKVNSNIPQGEQRAFMFNIQTNGINTPLTGYTADWLYTYKGSTNWYTIPGTVATNAGTVRVLWGPTRDAGKLSYTGWLRLLYTATTNYNYRCQVNVKMLKTPGYNPGEKQLEATKVDFATLSYTNVPYAWLTNAQDVARITSNEVNIASNTAAIAANVLIIQGTAPIGITTSGTTRTVTYDGTDTHNESGATNIPAAGLAVGGTFPAINGSALTALGAANITAGGTITAINGAAITNLNASNLASGTVPNATLDPELSAIAVLTSATNKVIWYTGSGTAALMDFTAYARTFVAVANAAAARTNLALVVGTDVQAWDADLDQLALLNGSGVSNIPLNTATGIVADANIAATITRDTELTAATNAVDANSWHINGDNYPTASMNGGGQALTNVAYLTLVSTNPSGNSIEAAGGAAFGGDVRIFATNDILWDVDGVGSIGAAATYRPKDIYASSTVQAGNTLQVGGTLFTTTLGMYRKFTDYSIAVGGGHSILYGYFAAQGDDFNAVDHKFYARGTNMFNITSSGADLLTGTLNLHTNKITYLEAGTAALDGANFGQTVAGGAQTAGGILNMASNDLYHLQYLRSGAYSPFAPAPAAAIGSYISMLPASLTFGHNWGRLIQDDATLNWTWSDEGPTPSAYFKVQSNLIVSNEFVYSDGVPVATQDQLINTVAEATNGLPRLENNNNWTGTSNTFNDVYADAYKIDVNSTNSAAFQWWAVSNRFAIVQIIGGTTNVTFVSP